MHTHISSIVFNALSKPPTPGQISITQSGHDSQHPSLSWPDTKHQAHTRAFESHNVGVAIINAGVAAAAPPFAIVWRGPCV